MLMSGRPEASGSENIGSAFESDGCAVAGRLHARS